MKNYAFAYDYVSDYAKVWGGLSEVATQAIHDDFLGGIVRTLNTFGVGRSKARSVGESLFGVMAGNYELRYHTPLHVLTMFSFADQTEIKLTAWQELAVWFHDAIYDRKAPPMENEGDSVTFMRSLLKRLVPEETLLMSEFAIMKTGCHMLKDVEDNAATVLDLDLASFAFTGENHEAAVRAISDELRPIYGDLYERGRYKFLNDLLARGFIYRTKQVRQRCEDVAMANIQQDIASLQRLFKPE